MKEPILEMRGITKKFGSVTANKDVDLTLYPGEIHALLGENGAGKSTLMNILNGIYKPNHGKIYYKGKKCFHSFTEACSRYGNRNGTSAFPPDPDSDGSRKCISVYAGL